MAGVKEAATNLMDAITENISNTVEDAKKEICNMIDSESNKILNESIAAMQEFIDRVDKGEVHNTYTYKKFKKIIKKHKEL